jgi:hypothetical protein
MAERGIMPLEPAVEANRPVLAGNSHGVGRARRHRVSDPSRIIVTPAEERVKKSGISWIRAARYSLAPLAGLCA